jgi:general secretion pathway protein G
MKTLTDSRGFTLIELVIVIAIVGVLAATAVIAMASYSEKAMVTQAIADIDRIYKALALLETDTNEWPGHQSMNEVNAGNGNEVWDLSTQEAGLVATDGGFSNWNGPYLPSIPKDPWGNDYFLDTDYKIDGVDYVVLGSFGPNGDGQNVYDEDNVIKIIN